jgi:3',5'-cyclic AMP phosphodiesterase CpdA
MHRVAVLSDPHVADVHYAIAGEEPGWPALRTLLDTAESTRVFNEGYHAFRAALDDIVERGLRIVVVCGDMTDDGQMQAWRAFNAIADEYAERFGLRFYCTPGNHDLFAMDGRHNAKRYLRRDGSHVLVTSDLSALDPTAARIVVSGDMYCPGYSGALPLMARLGVSPGPHDLHWESPFGTDPRLEARTYTARSADGAVSVPMVDASYLSEPEAGLWLLSLDANVYVPDRQPNGDISFSDRADEGWNAALAHKPHLLPWIDDVVRRARAGHKALLCFSHYPVVDPLRGTIDDELALFGNTAFARRMPEKAVTEAFAGSGMGVHFSGHWHVNDTGAWRGPAGFIVNVSMPAPVAFAAGYKIVGLAGDRVDIETVPLCVVPDHDLAFAAYDAEQRRTGASFGTLAASASHGEFLSRHVEQMVRRRYLVREWPADLAALVRRLTLADLERLAAMPSGIDVLAARLSAAGPSEAGDELTFMDLVVDWYRLRKAGQLAFDYIPPRRLAAWHDLAARFAARTWERGSVQAWLARAFGMMRAYEAGEPSRDFSVSLSTGAVTEDFGRTDRRQTGSG